MKNWKTKLVASITGLVQVIPIITDGIQATDVQEIATVLGAVATIWLLRDAVQKSGPTQP